MIRKLLLAALLSAAALPSQAENLVILHTNDTHSQIDPTDDGLGGVARRKVIVDSVRAASPNTLLIDAGDIVQGTLFFNLYKGEVEEKIMNALGYDIRILGNHEFDNGLDLLAKNLEVAEADLLASNYQMRGTPLDGLFLPYTLREYDGKLIAFLPVNLQPKGMISEANYRGMGYIDAIETANNLAWYLKHVLQADAVVAITHIGYSPSQKPGDVDLVQSSRDIDLVIGGHTHTLLDPANPESEPYMIANADGREILVAQSGKAGRYVGEITIDLDSIGLKAPGYRVIPVDSRLDSRVDGTVEGILAPYRAEVDALNSRKIARTPMALDKESTEMLNFASDFIAARGREMADNVDFAILNKGGLRNSLPKGDITEGQLITLMPFFNRIQVIDIKGDRLAQVFDVMARAGGNGVSSEVYATMDPDTHKCTAITINGKAIDPERTYRVATIDYLVNGGDYMEPLTDSRLVASSPNLMFEDLITYMRAGGKGRKIKPAAKQRMEFK